MPVDLEYSRELIALVWNVYRYNPYVGSRMVKEHNWGVISHKLMNFTAWKDATLPQLQQTVREILGAFLVRLFFCIQ